MIETDIRIPTICLQNSDQDQNNTENDLVKVKELSQKLQLAIKRRSVLQWKDAIEEKKLQGFFGNPMPEEEGLATIQEVTEKVGKQMNKTTSRIHEQESESNQSLSKRDKEKDFQKENCDTEETNNHLTTTCPLLSNTNSRQGLPSTSNDSTELSGDEKSTHYNCGLFPRKAEKRTNEAERRRKITESLSKIRRDLILMHMEDHSLARKLLDIREKLNRHKATVSCDEHAAMLDDFSWQIEEEEEFDLKYKASDLSSAMVRQPDSLLSSSSFLRHMGISKMSMDFRRFSVI